MNRAWWFVAAVDIAIIAWLYWAVKRAEPEDDPAEELTRALEAEMREYNERRRNLRDFDAKPFALDPEDPWAA